MLLVASQLLWTNSMILISESLCTFGEKRQWLVSGTKKQRCKKPQKVHSFHFGKQEVFTGARVTFSVSVFILITELIPPRTFQPPASSKVDFDNTFVFAWKAVRRSGNRLLSLRNFYNHVQELALFGALSPKQHSQSTTNVLPLCWSRMV